MLRAWRREEKTEKSDPEESTLAVEQLDDLVSEGLKFGTVYADPPWLYVSPRTVSDAKAEDDAALEDDTLHKMTDRIQAGAVGQASELLRQFQGGHGGDRKSATKDWLGYV